MPIIETNRSGMKGPVNRAKGIKHKRPDEILTNEFLTIKM